MQTYTGVMKAGELIGRCQIPHRHYSGDRGYQRLPTAKKRVTDLASEMRERRVDLPTALLLSVRGPELRPRLESSGRYVLKLPGNDEKPFFVVDGQHRLEALRKVIDDDEDRYWSEYKIPVVILFGSDETAEMEQFHKVNSNAKSIKTDLAFDLLTKLAQTHSELREYLAASGEIWKVNAQELTDLAAKRGVWTGKIRFPNEPKGNTLITSNSFASSLKPTLGQTNFNTYPLEKRARIIDAYWRGIEKVLPGCFHTPKRYNIQKTVGVYVFHNLLSLVLQRALTAGNPVDHPDTYAGILRKTLRSLSGENLAGGVSTGPGFWTSGQDGVAGVYSSGSGRQRLVQIITAALKEDWRRR